MHQCHAASFNDQSVRVLPSLCLGYRRLESIDLLLERSTQETLTEFMERDQLAPNVRIRICGEKTEQSTFQLLKRKVRRNDDTAMQAAIFDPLPMQTTKISTVMRDNHPTHIRGKGQLLFVRCFSMSCFSRRQDVVTPWLEAICQSHIDIMIEIESHVGSQSHPEGFNTCGTSVVSSSARRCS